MLSWGVMVRRRLSAGVLTLLGSLVVACGGAEPAPVTAWSADGEPLTTVSFVDDTQWPFELAKVALHFDDEVILEHDAAIGEHDRWVFEVPLASLAAGAHTLSFSVAARYASTRVDASDGCVVEVVGRRSFSLGAVPAGLRVVAKSHDVTRRFAERLELEVQTRGVTELRGVAPARRLTARDASCLDRAPLPFADHELSAPGAPPPVPLHFLR